MSQLCPDGHPSEMTDFCSECGIVMQSSTTSADAAPAATPTGAGSLACSNCSEPHGTDDVFCENCGFDFASGTLPDAEKEPTASAAPGAAPSPSPSTSVRVSVDLDYFAAIVESGEVELPDPVPAPTVVALTAGKALIGRHSESRGIFPEIDVEALTSDPAVSSRHAMLHRTESGGWEVNDLGSTNGTRLGDVESDELVAGTAYVVAPGTAFFVGAWTRIELQG